MACCALRKKKKQLMIVPVSLLLIVSLFGGIAVGLFTLGGLFSKGFARKRDRARKTMKQLTDGLKDRILNEPFLFDSTVRCKVSGRLMSHSTPLAGLVFKYFNVIVFSAVVGSASLVVGSLVLVVS